MNRASAVSFVVFFALLVGGSWAWAQEAPQDEADRIANCAALLRDHDNGGCQHARMLLMGIGAPAVPTVISLLSDEDERVREHAEDVLSSLYDEDALEAIPHLTVGLSSDDPAVRGAVVRALGNTGHEAAFPLLLTALSDPSPAVVAETRYALSLVALSQDNPGDLWSSVPGVLWKHGLALILSLMVWFALARWLPRRLSKHLPPWLPWGKRPKGVSFLLVCTPPVLVTGPAVYWVLSREPWIGSLSGSSQMTTIVPFEVAAALSVALCTVLAAALVCRGNASPEDPTLPAP